MKDFTRGPEEDKHQCLSKAHSYNRTVKRFAFVISYRAAVVLTIKSGAYSHPDTHFCTHI